MRTKLILLICLLTSINVMAQRKKKAEPAEPAPVKDEIIYHIFQRSFYDSNGDKHGDLEGIRLKLDYLQDLGVTAILLTPLYDSPFYHNYFANDFKKIDPWYGTMQSYLNLVKDVHSRGMKIYLDMETQYVTEDHIWWTDGVDNLKSKYADYILYQDSAHSKPSTIIFNLEGLKGYDGTYRKITTVNLNSPKVLEYNYQLFKYWMDPNGDGKFDDGVDGFRLDHMMDNLDGKAALPHLFSTFWNPLLDRLRKVNPAISIVAEQANWGSFGEDYLTKGGVDRVFGFRLAFAIRSYDKKQITSAADSTLALVKDGKQQVVFIENHDMPRFAYGVKGNLAKLKIAAALNLLLGGVPSIYYGQELGMSGTNAKLGATDANDIPNREAFEWYKSNEGKGMATWYKEKGPWKDQFNDKKPNDGISLEEERNKPNSLWNFYHEMIVLRRLNPVLINGTYKTLSNNNDVVYSFQRTQGNTKFVIAVNLSLQSQDVSIQMDAQGGTRLTQVRSYANPTIYDNTISLNIPPGAVEVWQLQ